MLTHVVIVVPVHDEAELLPGCLAALAVARSRIPLPSTVVVALDACTDASAAIAAAAGADRVRVAARSVGVARHAGAAAALARPDWRGCWIASTDADCRVGPTWLSRQLAHATAGADLVAGTVVVTDWTGWPPAVARRYRALYRQRVTATGHGHVHGANLGLTAVAYQALGGFPPLPLDEDRALVRAAVTAGLRVHRATDLPVRTSARPTARVRDGFSGHLHRIALSTADDRTGAH